MNTLDHIYADLTLPTTAKLVLLVLDGLGDLAMREEGYLTPLDAASTPNLDDLVQDSAQGRMNPVAPGITPGSGLGHLALFGYDPIEYQIGKGVVEALALGIELRPGDVAGRGNFCTLDTDGNVTDRRAGRIETPECERLCKILSDKVNRIDDVEVIIRPGKGHRFVVVLRGEGMEGPLSDSDPHCEGSPIMPVLPIDLDSVMARKTAEVFRKLYDLALPLLAGEPLSNGFLMRGITHQSDIPSVLDRYQLRSTCIAVNPVYQGLAQLVGMNKEVGPRTISDQFNRYLDVYEKYDYFFIHCNSTDMYGSGGDFEGKKKAIEDLDTVLPILLKKRPDVLAITGAHSTPCSVHGPSWHPQPVLLNSPFSGSDKLDRFSETSANLGSLGLFDAKYLMRLMQANARMFKKFGA